MITESRPLGEIDPALEPEMRSYVRKACFSYKAIFAKIFSQKLDSVYYYFFANAKK